MPPEPPTPPSRPRPGPDVRRRALGLDPDAPAPSVAPAAPAARESLAASLARIPDLRPGEVVEPYPSEPVRLEAPVAPPTAPSAPKAEAPAAAAAVAAAAVAAPAGSTTATATIDAPPVAEPAAAVPLAEPAVAPEPEAPLTGRAARKAAKRARISPPPHPPWWRRVAFAMAMIVFVGAIPVLGYVGSQVLKDSKAGSFTGSSLAPTDPGFEAQVEPTPTALAIQYDDQGVPVGLTFMALAGSDGGGTVIFIPVETEVAVPRFGIGNLKLAWESAPKDEPGAGQERLTSQVAQLLNVGITETVELDNASWDQLTAPVGPLNVENPDALDLGFGVTIPSGQTEVPSNLVGQYLAKSLPGESDVNRMVRHEALWRAWLQQVADSTDPAAVPGETASGIGAFARALADGPIDFQTLPVERDPEVDNLYVVDKTAMKRMITDAVASPTAATPGSRFTVRLLNGVSADALPGEVVREIVGRGGAVTILGNGPEFGREETEIVYNDPANEDVAELVATSLGATGKVRLDREAPDTVDLTIVLGSDILGEASGEGTPGSTVPTTTGGG